VAARVPVCGTADVPSANVRLCQFARCAFVCRVVLESESGCDLVNLPPWQNSSPHVHPEPQDMYLYCPKKINRVFSLQIG